MKSSHFSAANVQISASSPTFSSSHSFSAFPSATNVLEEAGEHRHWLMTYFPAATRTGLEGNSISPCSESSRAFCLRISLATAVTSCNASKTMTSSRESSKYLAKNFLDWNYVKMQFLPLVCKSKSQITRRQAAWRWDRRARRETFSSLLVFCAMLWGEHSFHRFAQVKSNREGIHFPFLEEIYLQKNLLSTSCFQGMVVSWIRWRNIRLKQLRTNIWCHDYDGMTEIHKTTIFMA